LNDFLEFFLHLGLNPKRRRALDSKAIVKFEGKIFLESDTLGLEAFFEIKNPLDQQPILCPLVNIPSTHEKNPVKRILLE
jgi:hypothetical protein